ncbi:MAG: hypothetical protein CL873_00375 [Dehalococcoidales bacterium]|nr:hypothetical protein [Dehalococcoidales bacterium]
MRNLKVALVLFGAIHMVQGLFLIVDPNGLAALLGFTESVEALALVRYTMALLGSAFIAAGVWFIITALNPLQNINGIRFAIIWAALLLVIQLYTVAQGYIAFSQTWTEISLTAIFTVAFLVFYPYRQR